MPFTLYRITVLKGGLTSSVMVEVAVIVIAVPETTGPAVGLATGWFGTGCALVVNGSESRVNSIIKVTNLLRVRNLVV